jgi:hypothetical protein
VANAAASKQTEELQGLRAKIAAMDAEAEEERGVAGAALAAALAAASTAADRAAAANIYEERSAAIDAGSAAREASAGAATHAAIGSIRAKAPVVAPRKEAEITDELAAKHAAEVRRARAKAFCVCAQEEVVGKVLWWGAPCPPFCSSRPCATSWQRRSCRTKPRWPQKSKRWRHGTTLPQRPSLQRWAAAPPFVHCTGLLA